MRASRGLLVHGARLGWGTLGGRTGEGGCSATGPAWPAGRLLRGLVGAGAARALGRVPGLDLVHLVADAAETGSVFDLEPVGGQGGRTGSVFLVFPVDHGCVTGTKALFLLPLCEGAGNGGDLKKGRGER
jgi:hypothetical protein